MTGTLTELISVSDRDKQAKGKETYLEMDWMGLGISLNIVGIWNRTEARKTIDRIESKSVRRPSSLQFIRKRLLSSPCAANLSYFYLLSIELSRNTTEIGHSSQ